MHSQHRRLHTRTCIQTYARKPTSMQRENTVQEPTHTRTHAAHVHTYARTRTRPMHHAHTRIYHTLADACSHTSKSCARVDTGACTRTCTHPCMLHMHIHYECALHTCPHAHTRESHVRAYERVHCTCAHESANTLHMHEHTHASTAHAHTRLLDTRVRDGDTASTHTVMRAAHADAHTVRHSCCCHTHLRTQTHTA